jgi:predicted amidohydrolase
MISYFLKNCATSYLLKAVYSIAALVNFSFMNLLHVTTIQSNLHWENKKMNLEMFSDKITRAGKTEIIVLPEMFNTGFSMQPEKFAERMDGESVGWMRDIASRHRVILTGSLMIEENGHFFNRLIWMLPNGHFGIYDKRHLFAYANEHEHYTPGNKRLVASVNGWKINLQVCYDLRFPVWCRQQISKEDDKSPEYDILIYVANWPERRSHAWKSLLIARAIENQCYVVGVNRVGNDGNNIYHSGDSMIIDALGETLYHGKDREEIHTAALDKEKLEITRNRFPFWKDADPFTL